MIRSRSGCPCRNSRRVQIGVQPGGRNPSKRWARWQRQANWFFVVALALVAPVSGVEATRWIGRARRGLKEAVRICVAWFLQKKSAHLGAPASLRAIQRSGVAFLSYFSHSANHSEKGTLRGFFSRPAGMRAIPGESGCYLPAAVTPFLLCQTSSAGQLFFCRNDAYSCSPRT